MRPWFALATSAIANKAALLGVACYPAASCGYGEANATGIVDFIVVNVPRSTIDRVWRPAKALDEATDAALVVAHRHYSGTALKRRVNRPS